MEALLGQLAAVGAAIAFSVTSTSFTIVGRSFRAELVMASSLPIGWVCLIALHWLFVGQPFPFDAETSRWVWLGASGIIGFWLSSIAIVNAFMLIGPRLALLVASISPIVSAFFAWALLHESLSGTAFIGIFITIAGIVWVVVDPGKSKTRINQPLIPDLKKGIVFAIIGAIGQALSLVLSKQGLEGDFSPVSGSVMRLTIACAAIWIFIILRGKFTADVHTLRIHPNVLRILFVGTVAGPVIGAVLTMISVQQAPVGIANTLINLTPIVLIPISYVVFHERISRGAVAGTVVAVAGTAILFLA